MTNQNIPCKLISRSGKKVEIDIDGQKVLISSDFIPASTPIGDTIYLGFLNQDDAKLREDGLAKLILEEILNGK